MCKTKVPAHQHRHFSLQDIPQPFFTSADLPQRRLRNAVTGQKRRLTAARPSLNKVMKGPNASHRMSSEAYSIRRIMSPMNAIISIPASAIIVLIPSLIKRNALFVRQNNIITGQVHKFVLWLMIRSILLSIFLYELCKLFRGFT